jgi:mannose-6-phosphate isomerase
MGIENPAGEPQAELWMGAHPSAPSTIRSDLSGKDVSLIDWIAEDPTGILGADVAIQFSNQLPFLFKVLAAAQPLSLQAHPNREQARAGFDREDRVGIPIDSPMRCYRDRLHKPELICALTTFFAMSGFRTPGEIADRIGCLELPELREPVAALECGTDSREALRNFLRWMLERDEAESAKIAEAAVAKCRDLPERFDRAWVIRLAERYPTDISVLSPLFLHVIRLEAGQALYLPAGQLHSYLDGTGLEIMANSDNVLRGGLTKKHIDAKELLEVLTYTSEPPDVLTAQVVGPGESAYRTQVEEFELSRVDVAGEYHRGKPGGVEILICTRGAGKLSRPQCAEEANLSPGTSLLVPADVRDYEVRGNCTFFRAGLP